MGHRTHLIVRAVGVMAAASALWTVAAAAPASAAASGFKASIAGALQVTGANESGPTSAFYSGAGMTSPLGLAEMQGDISIVGPADCAGGFQATHADTLTAATGTVVMTIKETSCPRPELPGTFDCRGSYRITGGTGAYSGARGAGSWAGSLSFTSQTEGTFTTTYTGSITRV